MRLRAALIAAAALGAGCGGGGGASRTHWTWSDAGYVEPPHSEEYRCFYVEMPTGGHQTGDVGIGSLSFVSTSGALHHLVVFRDGDKDAQHDETCSGAPMSLNWTILYAAGRNTGPLVPPAGVALAADSPVERLVIQLHLLNATDAPITDDTRLDVGLTRPGASFTPASLLIGGSVTIDLPPDGAPHDVVGSCSVPADMQVFAIWPHMHQLGTEFRIDRTHAAAIDPLLDWSWHFADQALFQPTSGTLSFAAGDTLTTTCTYVNVTGAPVGYGPLTSDEMCFDYFYYYPAAGPSGLRCGY